MSDLDKKVETLVNLAYSHGVNDGVEARREKTTTKGIAKKIKKAFKDAYWIDTMEAYTYVDGGTRLITGREWYNKFVTEFPRAGLLPELQGSRPQILETAKRAAGLK